MKAPDIKILFDKAALKRFTDSVDKFSASVEKAAKVMEQHNLILNKTDSEAFIKALTNPRKPDIRMSKALARRKARLVREE